MGDFVVHRGGGGGGDLVADLTPQLGGDLDLNGKNIDFPTTANISDCLDEDTMASDSATMLATQQSIKAYIDTIHGVVRTNILLNAFRIQVNGGLSVQNMVDGVVDEFEDQTGIEDDDSTNETYDSTNDHYSNPGPATIAATASLTNTANQTIYTFSTVALGDAATSRKILVGASVVAGGSITITGLTVQGITATEIKEKSITQDTTTIYVVAVPTGTTGDIVVTASTSANNCGIDVYRTTGMSATAHATGESSVDPLIANLNIPAGGIAIGHAVISGGVCAGTWTSLTENQDTNLESSNTHTGAAAAFAAQQSSLELKCDCTGTFSRQGAAFASFGPSGGDAPDMTLLSEPTTALAVPDEVFLAVWEEDVDSVTLNTDLLAWVTREAGVTVTTDFGTDEKFDASTHGFANTDRVMVTSSSQDLPAGSDSATVYYVVNKTTNDFELSLTSGGSAINITDNGTGTHTARRWKQVTLAKVAALSTGQILTGSADVSGLTSGTAMRNAIVTDNNKEQKIHATGTEWS